MTAQRVTRGTLTNLDSGETKEFPSNPSTFQDGVEVAWQDHVVLGLSHPVSQYVATGAYGVPSVKFRVDAFKMARELGRAVAPADVADFYNFALSLTVPWDEFRSSPPKVLFVWPHVAIVTMVVRSVKRDIIKQAADGVPLIYDVDIAFTEKREDERLAGVRVRLYGTDRGEYTERSA